MSDYYDDLSQEQSLLDLQYQQDLRDPGFQQSQDEMLIQQPQDFEVFGQLYQQQEDDFGLFERQDLQYQQQDDDAAFQQYQQDLTDPGFQQSQDDALWQVQYQQQDDDAAFQQYQQDLTDPGFQQSQDDALWQVQFQQQQDDDLLVLREEQDQLQLEERADEVQEEFQLLQDQWGQGQWEPPAEYQPGAEDLDEPGRIPELDSGYDPNWAPEGAHRFPAESKGEWIEGGKGDGWWQPYDPGAYGLEAGDSIPFREGVPDFRDYAVPTDSGNPGVFDVAGLKGGGRDYDLAVAQLAEQEGMTFRECQEWLRENDLRLHHYGGDEMQIVPERLHGALGHQGSATEMRE